MKIDWIKEYEEYLNIGKKLNKRYLYILFNQHEGEFIISYNPFLTFKYIVAGIVNLKNGKEMMFYNFSFDNADIVFDYEGINNE